MFSEGSICLKWIQFKSPHATSEAVAWRRSWKFCKIHRKIIVRIFFNKVQACDFIKKETLVHVLSCEFCEISKNSYSYRTPPVAASATLISRYLLYFCKCNNVKSYSNAFLTIDERCFHENFNISHEIITPSSCSK